MSEVAPAAGDKEGRRSRKRRQTRGRIEKAALALFLERGFAQTTIDDIAEAADVSKRSFFDYFPSKDEVVFAWQDSFADDLAAAVAARPPGEPLLRVAEEALRAAILAAFTPQSMALVDLIRDTPALCARDHLKYARLEGRLTSALLARCGDTQAPRLRIRLLSAVVIGAMRVGGETWHAEPRPDAPEDFVRDLFTELRELLATFGGSAEDGLLR